MSDVMAGPSERMVRANELEATATHMFGRQRMFALVVAALAFLLAMVVFIVGFAAINKDTETIKQTQEQGAMALRQARNASLAAARGVDVASCLAVYATTRDAWADQRATAITQDDFFGALRASVNAAEVGRRRLGVAVLARRHTNRPFVCPPIPRNERFRAIVPHVRSPPPSTSGSGGATSGESSAGPTLPIIGPTGSPPTRHPRSPPTTRPRPRPTVDCPGNSPPPCPRPDPTPGHHGHPVDN